MAASNAQRELIRHYAQRSIATPCLLLALLFSFLLSFLPLAVQGADKQLMVYAELNNYDSDSFEQNPYRIFIADVLEEAGYEALFSVVPWTRLVQSLTTQPDVLGFHMTRTPGREDSYHWIGRLRPINFKLWGLRERANELPHTLDGAKNLRISATRDDVVANYLLEQGFTNLVFLSENSNTVNMLRRDRLDLMPYIESGMSGYLLRQDQPQDTLAPVIDLDEISTGHYLVMSKNSDQELVQRLQDAFQRLLDRGELSRIQSHAPAR